MRTLGLALAATLVAALGCKKEPCGGRGMEVDPRPLTEEFSEGIGAPAGAVVCRGAGDGSQPNKRHFAFPDKEPGEVLSLWRKQLKANGWKETSVDASKGPTDSHCTTGVTFEKKGGMASVSVSECEGRNVKGWSTVYLRDL